MQITYIIIRNSRGVCAEVFNIYSISIQSLGIVMHLFSVGSCWSGGPHGARGTLQSSAAKRGENITARAIITTKYCIHTLIYGST